MGDAVGDRSNKQLAISKMSRFLVLSKYLILHTVHLYTRKRKRSHHMSVAVCEEASKAKHCELPLPVTFNDLVYHS